MHPDKADIIETTLTLVFKKSTCLSLPVAAGSLCGSIGSAVLQRELHRGHKYSDFVTSTQLRFRYMLRVIGGEVACDIVSGVQCCRGNYTEGISIQTS